jgi:hypothetical protein
MNSKLPNQITVANRSGHSGLAIQKNGGKTMLAHSVPYLARQLSAFDPVGVLSQQVNQMLRVPNLDGDARRMHGDLSWFGQKKALRPAGRR